MSCGGVGVNSVSLILITQNLTNSAYCIFISRVQWEKHLGEIQYMTLQKLGRENVFCLGLWGFFPKHSFFKGGFPIFLFHTNQTFLVSHNNQLAFTEGSFTCASPPILLVLLPPWKSPGAAKVTIYIWGFLLKMQNGIPVSFTSSKVHSCVLELLLHLSGRGYPHPIRLPITFKINLNPPSPSTFPWTPLYLKNHLWRPFFNITLDSPLP